MTNTPKPQANTLKVYEREYDAPLKKDGTKKPNKYLGEFNVVSVIEEDMYASKRIVEKEGKQYLLDEIEVSGFYHEGQGGSRFILKEITQTPVEENL